MKTYKVTYSGNASRFKKLSKNVDAISKRDAVEKFYSEYMNDNYFPEDDGTIKDCDGEIVADPDDSYIKYDGGYFEAEEV